MVVAGIGWVLGCCNSSIGEVCSDAHVGHMLCITDCQISICMVCSGYTYSCGG
jgi:hypothetical protein